MEAFLWYGFVQAAVYNAVNGITGEYELYEWDTKAPTGASPQAAAAVAAHRVLANPPYPDWPSGLTGVIGALSTTLSRLNADGRVDLNITSAAAGQGGPSVTRHYDDAAVLQRDAIDARVWSGIHFRTADQAGVAIGVQVGNLALDHYFAAVPAPVPTPAPPTQAPQITAPPTDGGDFGTAPSNGGEPWIAVGLLTILGLSIYERTRALRRR